MSHRLVRELQKEAIAIKQNCRVLCVSRSGYYEAQRRAAKPAVCKASVHLKAAFLASHQSYGSRRLVTAMNNQGNEIERYKVSMRANRIHWNASKAKGVSTASGLNVVAAQAPRKFDACEKLVRHAIEFKQGIFQIVDLQSSDGSLATQPIVGQLLAMSKLPAKLGENCEVVALKQAAQTKNSVVYQLTVRSLADGVETTIPITQDGLRFDDALLRSKEINEAESLLNAHIALNKKLNPATVSEPVIISQAGVGRNATVIVYHAIMKEIAAGKITNEKELDAALTDLIVASRKSRGPHSLHSQAQLNELVGLLTKNLPKSWRSMLNRQNTRRPPAALKGRNR